MAAISVSFNGYVLQNSSFRTRIIQHTDIPEKLVQAEGRARADGMQVVNVRYGGREIDVEGMMSAADRQTLVTLIDTMKLNIKDASGVLDIDYGNGTRRYYATVTKLDIPEDFYNITSVPYKITFFCADPFGYATTSGNLSFSGVTAMLNDYVITVSGSIDSDPVVQLTLTTVVAHATITLSNETTGEAIVIAKATGNFSNGDVVLIDCKRKVVQLNGSGLDYTGRFPGLSVPTTRLRIAMAATSVNYAPVVRYSPRYL